ncbi:hypothetical protein LUZ60_013554 [Juncus effusus]|nr:hypothetical protein LUZ60_013554 [Juncus effusus]
MMKARTTTKTKTPKSNRRGGGGRGRGRRSGNVSTSSSGVAAAMDLSVQLESVVTLQQHPSGSSRFQKVLEGSAVNQNDEDSQDRDKDCILSQDFFCTPDYITPDAPQIPSCLQFGEESVACPKSPEKSTVSRNKRYKRDLSPSNQNSTNLESQYESMEVVQMDASSKDGFERLKHSRADSQKKPNYVSQTAVALRCRVMPPPCIKNPYLNNINNNGNNEIDVDVFCDRRQKSSGYSPSIGGAGLSRYHTDFHEIEQIGCGNFSRVFKVLKRIDGCLYAVKQSIRQLHNVTERKRALMEVQALAALGSHENIIGYYTSWFENEHLYIQMELCDYSLSINRNQALKCNQVLQMLYQIAKALDYIHGRGVAHLDVKPDNIYHKPPSLYKLGDFGCATLLDRSLGVEEGDARYMPLELLNDQYEHLDKVDMFSLGAAVYEIAKGSRINEKNVREGRISLLPGYPVQFQNLIKAMMDPDPVKRPSAREILMHPIFDKLCFVSTKDDKFK